MNKWVLSTAVAAALAGSAFTYTAVAAPDAADAPQAHRMAERGFLLDAKLAGMKAALNLTPEQEKLWPAFETAVRDAAKARREAMMARREGMEEGQRPSPIAMMTQMSERLAKASDEIKKVADAATPLYNSLDDTQKGHFGPLMRMLRGGEGHRGGGHSERGPMGPKPL
jgi:Spy/CpxP family protein refolding chaperone